MEQAAEVFPVLGQEDRESSTITTTLGKLIEAIVEEADTEKDNLVTDVVFYLLENGRIRFLNPKGKLALLWPVS